MREGFFKKKKMIGSFLKSISICLSQLRILYCRYISSMDHWECPIKQALMMTYLLPLRLCVYTYICVYYMCMKDCSYRLSLD